MRISLIVFLIVQFSKVAAQSDTLFNRPYAERVEAIRYLYRQVIESYPDTARVSADQRTAAGCRPNR